jgi:hypothetical protein
MRYGYFTTKVAKGTEFSLLHPRKRGRNEVDATFRDHRALRGEVEFSREFVAFVVGESVEENVK